MSQRVTIEALAQWLKARDDIALMGHVAPDGDATGCCLAMAHALRAMGKRAAVCLPEGVPLLYAGLPGAEAVVPTGAPLVQSSGAADTASGVPEVSAAAWTGSRSTAWRSASVMTRCCISAALKAILRGRITIRTMNGTL